MAIVGPELEYKIVPEDSLSIIGSNSKDSQGELYTIDIKLAIATPFNRRTKRLFDILASLLLLATLPLNILIIPNPGQLIQNLFSVLTGRKTWVGYGGKEHQQQQLPRIKKGVISPIDELAGKTLRDNNSLDGSAIARINLRYAKDYRASSDAELLLKCFRKLGK